MGAIDGYLSASPLRPTLMTRFTFDRVGRGLLKCKKIQRVHGDAPCPDGPLDANQKRCLRSRWPTRAQGRRRFVASISDLRPRQGSSTHCLIMRWVEVFLALPGNEGEARKWFEKFCGPARRPPARFGSLSGAGEGGGDEGEVVKWVPPNKKKGAFGAGGPC